MHRDFTVCFKKIIAPINNLVLFCCCCFDFNTCGLHGEKLRCAGSPVPCSRSGEMPNPAEEYFHLTEAGLRRQVPGGSAAVVHVQGHRREEPAGTGTGQKASRRTRGSSLSSLQVLVRSRTPLSPCTQGAILHTAPRLGAAAPIQRLPANDGLLQG